MNGVSKTGAAHAGLVEWLVQRLTAVYMFLFLVYVLFAVGDRIGSYEPWAAWFADGRVRWAWVLFYLSALWHSWIGLRSVFLDYIKPFWLRLTLTLGSAILLIVHALWVIDILYIRGIGRQL